MPRILQITVPTPRARALVNGVRKRPGVLGVRWQPGASVVPPGDVVGVEVLARHHAGLMCWLQAEGIGCDPGTTITSDEPGSMVARETAGRTTTDTTESSWEEMEFMLARESHMTASSLAIMTVAGVCAATGLATGALHLVAASMLIAPGFEPLVRVALGVCASSRAWRRGLWSFVTGYSALIAGAALAAWTLKTTGTDIRGGERSYLPSRELIDYWARPNASAFVVSVAGAVAGTLLVVSNRSVLTSGAMLALALIPSAALIGMGAVAGDAEMVILGAMRWAIEVGLVVGFALAIFGWKRLRTHRRPMMV